MNAVRGIGSSVMASPMTTRSMITTPEFGLVELNQGLIAGLMTRRSIISRRNFLTKTTTSRMAIAAKIKDPK